MKVVSEIQGMTELCMLFTVLAVIYDHLVETSSTLATTPGLVRGS